MKTPILTIDSSACVEDRLTANAQHNILPARYLRKDENGTVIESPAELFERVAQNVAAVQDNYEAGPSADEMESDFENAMKELRFMPNSPTLMNAGTDMNQLSACFVLEPEDKMGDPDDGTYGGGILPTSTEAGMVFKTGGGCGYPFHHLRPKGSYISTTGGYSSGPVSFMRVFDEVCNQVEQGGKRRGAQMGIMRVDHADVGRFATAKRDEGELDNFNISVGVTDGFLAALDADDDYVFYDPQSDYEEPFEVIPETEKFYSPEYENNPESAFDTGEGEPVDENFWRDHADDIEVVQDGQRVPIAEKWKGEFQIEAGEQMSLPAEFIWDVMVDGAWRNGEPGIFYLDWTREDDSQEDSDIDATNPCAEQPLSEYEACNLGHVNLSLMVDEDAMTFSQWEELTANPGPNPVSEYVGHALDTDLFYDTVETGTRFLENVVDASEFPLEEIEDTVDRKRKIGLGIMGLAQMLYQMGVAYDSKIGRQISAEVMARINHESARVSHELAKERGPCDFYYDSKWAEPTEHPDWFQRHTGMNPLAFPDGFEVRNHNQTTIAPTGTTSMLGDTSGGCEPVFSVAYYKNVGGDIQGDDFLVEFDSYFLQTLEENGLYVDAVKREAEQQMQNDEFDGISGLDTVPDEFGDVFVTTQQISPEDHTLMQRRLQMHVDSGISKTINLPSDATRDDVDSAYRLALSRDEVGLPAKGLTVYRDDSRDEQVKATTADMGKAGSLDADLSDVEERLVDLYQSDEITDQAVAALATESDLSLEDKLAGEICEECHDAVLEQRESCPICPECGYSPCS